MEKIPELSTAQRIEKIKGSQELFSEMYEQLPDLVDELKLLCAENFPELGAEAYRKIPEFHQLAGSSFVETDEVLPAELRKTVLYHINRFLDKVEAAQPD